MIASIGRYARTLRYLRREQVVGRLVQKFPKKSIAPISSISFVTPAVAPWHDFRARSAGMTAPDTFRFLGQEHAVSGCAGWNDPQRDALWLFNAHYFDDINAHDASARQDWHQHLLSRWIHENPPGAGVGWHPYPTSLRIVNWSKWQLRGNSLSTEQLQSLGLQVEHLNRRIERHLLGNHWLANLKALCFASTCFSWSPRTVSSIDDLAVEYVRVLDEQLDANGAHEELSPMYHALMLEDTLDLFNLGQAYGIENLTTELPSRIGAMRAWHRAMCHPDGDIGLFNDAALGIAFSLHELESYAQLLGLPPLGEDVRPLLPAAGAAGYVSWRRDDIALLLDCAPIGPDHLPGHGHADYLTFELSVHGQRVIVDTGTSQYAEGTERDRQRGTRAHNTPSINGANSAEVWKSFRVGRRGSVEVTCRVCDETLDVSASHTGYAHLGVPAVRRRWVVDGDTMTIFDTLESDRAHANLEMEITLPFHLHPGVDAEANGVGTWNIRSIRGEELLSVAMDSQLVTELQYYAYHPRFGESVPGQELVGHWRGRLPVTFQTKLSWAGT